MQYRAFIFCGLALFLAHQAFAQSSQSEGTSAAKFTFGNRSYFPIRKKPTKEQKRRLQPSPEDAQAYASFLQQPNTGIFRLLPDSGCETNSLVIKATEDCLNAVPESSFYSFREEEHTQNILADIRLKGNYLISDGILSQGILVALGDFPLESVTLQHEGLKFLNDYSPPTSTKEIQKQFLQINNGVRSGGYEYRKIIPAQSDTTYGLRVVAYKGRILRSFRGFNFDLLAGDKRVDLTLAFRIVRRDKSGAVTLIWKELTRKEAPKIKFERKRIR